MPPALNTVVPVFVPGKAPNGPAGVEAGAGPDAGNGFGKAEPPALKVVLKGAALLNGFDATGAGGFPKGLAPAPPKLFEGALAAGFMPPKGPLGGGPKRLLLATGPDGKVDAAAKGAGAGALNGFAVFPGRVTLLAAGKAGVDPTPVVPNGFVVGAEPNRFAVVEGAAPKGGFAPKGGLAPGRVEGAATVELKELAKGFEEADNAGVEVVEPPKIVELPRVLVAPALNVKGAEAGVRAAALLAGIGDGSIIGLGDSIAVE